MIKSKLKVVLAYREMTQKELAAITGIRPPTISALCNDLSRHIPVDAMDKICDVLQCQPGDIWKHIKNDD